MSKKLGHIQECLSGAHKH